MTSCVDSRQGIRRTHSLNAAISVRRFQTLSREPRIFSGILNFFLFTGRSFWEPLSPNQSVRPVFP